jgi:hypothetical protein
MGASKSCYDRFEGVNLTGPGAGKLWIGTTDLAGRQPESAEDVVQYLQDDAAVTVHEQSKTTVGGYPTRTFSLIFTVDTSLSRYEWGFNYPDWVPELETGHTAQAWLVETGDPNLFILAAASSAEPATAEFLDQARNVVSSMTITHETPTMCD